MNLRDFQIDNPSIAEIEALSAYKSAADDPDGKSQCFMLNRQLEHGLFPDEMGKLGEITLTLDGIFNRCPRLGEQVTV